jgi:hypothetical protein
MRTTLIERFEAKYIPEPNSGCWLWLGSASGGVRATIRDHGAKYAARVSWELHNGLIADGLLVLYRCDVPLCVNPHHLFLGTHLDNARDKYAKGRGHHAKGEAQGSAKLTDREVWEIKQLSGYLSQRKIAKAYGMSQAMVWNVQHERNWRHLP